MTKCKECKKKNREIKILKKLLEAYEGVIDWLTNGRLKGLREYHKWLKKNL